MTGRVPLILVGFALLGLATMIAMTVEDPLVREPAPEIPAAGVEVWVCPSGTVGRVRCAYVSAPEDYSDPEIRSVKLFTAVIDPPIASEEPPLAFIGADLGAAGASDFGAWQQISRRLGRTIVLIDLRGTGRSEPRIACPQLSNVPWLESDLGVDSRDAAVAARADGLKVCRGRLDESVPVDAYSLDAMARDVEVVRDRLDIDRWTLFAGGDAGFIARRAESLFPAVIDSLVLVGATDTSSDRQVNRYRYAVDVLDAALGDELASELDEAIAPLADRSVVSTVTTAGRTRRVAASAETIKATLARAAGEPSLTTPLDILVNRRLANANWRSIAILRSQQYPIGRGRPVTTALSVTCGDPTMVDAPPLWDAVDDFDVEWTSLLDDPTIDVALCDAWNPLPNEGVVDAPESPTLVVNGALDVTAPAAAAAAISWPNADVFAIAEIGRPNYFDDCIVETIRTFLDAMTPTMRPTCS